MGDGGGKGRAPMFSHSAGLAVRRPDVFLKEMNTTTVQLRLLKYGQESSPSTGNDKLIAVNARFKVSMVVF